MSAKPRVIIIGGPTASGKTRLAIELAKELNGEIISADSRQIYKYMDIGTAKATPEERAEAPHHLIDILEPDIDYSAGKFAEDAAALIREIVSRGATPIVCGGTGLYVEALTQGLRKSEKTDPDVRALVGEITAKEGKIGLIQRLEELDPQSLELYPDKNPSRLARALEFCLTTGEKFSEGLEDRDRSAEFDFVSFGIELEREILYSRINVRSEKMWSDGLIDETEKLLSMGFEETANSLNTVGYKETIAYVKGTLDGNEALELIKRNTRRYAKRQMTWFRNRANLQFMSGEIDTIAKNILAYVKKLI